MGVSEPAKKTMATGPKSRSPDSWHCRCMLWSCRPSSVFSNFSHGPLLKRTYYPTYIFSFLHVALPSLISVDPIISVFGSSRRCDFFCCVGQHINARLLRLRRFLEGVEVVDVVVKRRTSASCRLVIDAEMFCCGAAIWNRSKLG